MVGLCLCTGGEGHFYLKMLNVENYNSENSTKFNDLQQQIQRLRGSDGAKISENKHKIRELDSKIARLIQTSDYLSNKTEETYERLKEFELRERDSAIKIGQLDRLIQDLKLETNAQLSNINLESIHTTKSIWVNQNMLL